MKELTINVLIHLNGNNLEEALKTMTAYLEAHPAVTETEILEFNNCDGSCTDCDGCDDAEEVLGGLAEEEVECPHCGWMKTIDPNSFYTTTQLETAGKNGEVLEDMYPCDNCGELVYLYFYVDHDKEKDTYNLTIKTEYEDE